MLVDVIPVATHKNKDELNANTAKPHSIFFYTALLHQLIATTKTQFDFSTLFLSVLFCLHFFFFFVLSFNIANVHWFINCHIERDMLKVFGIFVGLRRSRVSINFFFDLLRSLNLNLKQLTGFRMKHDNHWNSNQNSNNYNLLWLDFLTENCHLRNSFFLSIGNQQTNY